ncbi:hypothetical protein Pfo_008327 [Paulownia fortunei]|nr:hypothetical protein Pfo_008327 [Paulownia fortunei]
MTRPEESIAEGYVVNKILTFSSLYVSQIKTRFTRPECNKDASQPILFTLSVFNQQVRVMGSQQNHKLPLALRKKVHCYVLNNCKEVDRYRKLRNQKNPEATDELYSLALGPDIEVRLYDACIVNRVQYHTLSRDNLDFFGVLKDVVLIFYTFRYKVYLFWCDWFQCNPKKIIVQEFGLTCIDTSKTWYEDDPFILATQTRQVYYLDDIKHGERWKVVQKVQHREIYEIIEKEDENSEEHEFESSSNNEPNQEISSHKISLSIREDLEILDLCRLDIQPQHIELLDIQASLSENMHNFINDEDVDTQLDSE